MDPAHRPVPFEQLGRGDAAAVGLKCAHLGELTGAGFPVPPGFALPVAAHRAFLEGSGAAAALAALLDPLDLDPGDPGALQQLQAAAREARASVEGRPLPAALANAIDDAYRALGERLGVDAADVAVRSAGPASHPGQYDSYLHVRGADAVRDHVRRVWSSAFNARSLLARARDGVSLARDGIGVAVMAMVDAEAAGVMMTRDPVGHDASRIVIEGIWGLGQRLVGGETTPDRWSVDRVLREVIERRVSTQVTELRRDPASGRPAPRDVEPDRRDRPCLDDGQAIALAAIGDRLETHFGAAQDVEWALDRAPDGSPRPWILQTRDEPSWARRRGTPRLDVGGRSWGSLLGEGLGGRGSGPDRGED